jgi:hypothetical protein
MAIQRRRHWQKVLWFLCETPDIFVQIEPNLDFLERSSYKSPGIKFRGNACNGSRVFTCGQMDRQDEAVGAFGACLRTRRK